MGDVNRLANGQEPLYMAQRLAQSEDDMSLFTQLKGPASGRFFGMAYKVPQMTAADVKMEVSADKLKYIERFPPAEVCSDRKTIGLVSTSPVLLQCCAGVLRSAFYSASTQCTHRLWSWRNSL